MESDGFLISSVGLASVSLRGLCVKQRGCELTWGVYSFVQHIFIQSPP